MRFVSHDEPDHPHTPRTPHTLANLQHICIDSALNLQIGRKFASSHVVEINNSAGGQNLVPPWSLDFATTMFREAKIKFAVGSEVTFALERL